LTQNAKLIAKWRGIVVRQDMTGFNPPMIEVSSRMAQTLYALTRGHALLYGRTQITVHDAGYIMATNFGNMPEERARLFRAFYDAGWESMVSTGDVDNPKSWEIYWGASLKLRACARAMGCSEDKAKRVLEELDGLGVIKYTEGQGYQLVL
jgi:hypothetical protein